MVTYLSVDQAGGRAVSSADQAEGKGKEERGGLLRRRKLGMCRCSEQQRGEREESRPGRHRARRRSVGVLARARVVAASVTLIVTLFVTARVTVLVAVVVTAVIVVVAVISLGVFVAVFVTEAVCAASRLLRL